MGKHTQPEKPRDKVPQTHQGAPTTEPADSTVEEKSEGEFRVKLVNLLPSRDGRRRELRDGTGSERSLLSRIRF